MQPPEQLSLRAPTPPRASSHDSSMSTSRKPNPSLTHLLGVPGAAGAVVVGAMAVFNYFNKCFKQDQRRVCQSGSSNQVNSCGRATTQAGSVSASCQCSGTSTWHSDNRVGAPFKPDHTSHNFKVLTAHFVNRSRTLKTALTVGGRVLLSKLVESKSLYVKVYVGS
jgi:hypothetical protein